MQGGRIDISRKAALALSIAGLAWLAGAWGYPRYRDMARRHQVAEVLVAARPLLNEIAYRALEKKSLAGTGHGLAVTPTGPLTGGEVSEDGVILVRGSVDGYPVEVGFRPMLADGAFEWRCRGLRVVEGWFVPRDGYFPGACPRASAESPF